MKRRIRIGFALLTLLMVMVGFSLPVTAFGPVILGSPNPPPANVDLTLEGSLDWDHWGIMTPTDWDHMCCIAPQITNYWASGPVFRIIGTGVTYQWTNGTPNAAAITDTGVLINTVGDFFRLRVPASPIHRVIRVHVGVRSARGELRAYLSDGSAPPYVNVLDAPGILNTIYKIEFASAAPGQTLTVEWTLRANYGGVPNSGIVLQSASLN